MMVYSMGSQERQDRFKILKSVGCSVAPQARYKTRYRGNRQYSDIP